jgi:hypothetical protein
MMKRTMAYVIRTEFKVNRRATGRATSHIKQPEIKMDRRATKRATQHINGIWNLDEFVARRSARN